MSPAVSIDVPRSCPCVLKVPDPTRGGGGAASSWNHLEVLKTFSVMLTGSGMESAVSALVETFRECFQNIHNGSRRRRRKEKMRLRATTVIFGEDANSCKTYQL